MRPFLPRSRACLGLLAVAAVATGCSDDPDPTAPAPGLPPGWLAGAPEGAVP